MKVKTKQHYRKSALSNGTRRLSYKTWKHDRSMHVRTSNDIRDCPAYHICFLLLSPMEKQVSVHPELGLDKSMRATYRPEAKGHDDNAYETEILLRICKLQYITRTSGMHEISGVHVQLDCAKIC